MASLFPSDSNLMSLENIRPQTPVGYKQSINFDDNTGDVSCDGMFKVETASGIEAWKQWCVNCLQTERYAFPSYSTDFGINTKPLKALYDNSSRELYLKKEITDALMADDYKRTKSVSGFVFDWAVPDTVTVSFVITGIDNAKIDLSVNINWQG